MNNNFGGEPMEGECCNLQVRVGAICWLTVLVFAP